MSGSRQLPDGWSEVRLEELFEFKRGAGLSKSSVVDDGRNLCILYGELYTTYQEVIDQVASRTDSTDGVPSKIGDILMPTSTTTTGIDLATASVLLRDGVLLGGDINILRPKNKQVNPVFFAYYLKHGKKHELGRLAQGVTIYHLYARDVKKVEVALPPLAEQERIASMLTTAQREIDLLGKLAEHYGTQKRGLMQKLLTGEWRVTA